jgi:hypothetical protein
MPLKKSATNGNRVVPTAALKSPATRVDTAETRLKAMADLPGHVRQLCRAQARLCGLHTCSFQNL